MILSAEAVPEGLDALMPAWAQQLGLLGILMAILFAWLRGWVVTRAAADREVDAERRIGDIWKENYQQSAELNQQLTGAFQPVLDSNAAILKVVESLQERQERAEQERWMRDGRGGPPR